MRQFNKDDPVMTSLGIPGHIMQPVFSPDSHKLIAYVVALDQPNELNREEEHQSYRQLIDAEIKYG
jgi:hypothetical protein